jgi:SAM-dependent methyltransferase
MASQPSISCDRPRYMSRGLPRAFRALFAGDTALDIECSRARAYPGLGGPAPDTRALYRAALALVPGARRAIDLGCGAGLGTAELLAQLDSVLGLDTDPEAVRFAQHYLPEARIELEDDKADGLPQADLVCVVDVLGQAPAPERLLRQARRALGPDGRVFIAEAQAYPTQDLLPPVTQAFSKPMLLALMARAGLEPELWLDDVGHFVVCLARPASDELWQALEQAELAAANGDHAQALQLFTLASESRNPNVALEGRLGVAQAHCDFGQLDRAAAALLGAAREAPSSARPLAGLSLLSLVANDRTSALSLAVQAIENDPAEAAAAQALAEAADSLQQADALAAWRLTSSLAPADVRAASELARLAAERGDFAYAISVLERLREFRADVGVDFHVTLGWLCLQAGRVADAQLEAEVARVMDPEGDAVRELWARIEAAPRA